MTPTELGLAEGTIIQVTPNGKNFAAVIHGTKTDVTSKLEKVGYLLKNAVKKGTGYLRLDVTKRGQATWRDLSKDEVKALINANTSTTIVDDIVLSTISDDVIRDMVAKAYDLKPEKLRIADIWWKFAVRSVLRAHNLLIVGPHGCGKGLLAASLKKALGRDDQFFYVNFGATQDARSSLIGNTHFDKDAGTFTAQSYFCKAIQVPNAIILLDEVSRATNDAQNILLPVLDHTQRYLRIDEDKNTPTIKVAEGVSFVMTANIGSEYSATRTLDRAFIDRCTIIEMQPMEKDDELANLKYVYPNVSDADLNAIAEIAIATRTEIKSETSRIDTIISTRQTETIAGLIADGFTLAEAAEVCIYPYYSEAGGAESARGFVKILVQKHLNPDNPKTTAIPIDPNDPNNGWPTPWTPPTNTP